MSAVSCPVCWANGEQPCDTKSGRPHKLRTLAEVNAERGHSLKRLGRTTRGHSPIRGWNATYYATTWVCECGARGQINQAPSAGGDTSARQSHQRHSDESVRVSP